jgi:protein gp37
MVFVNSMSDLFHKEVPASFINAVAEVMCEASWHTYQVLTKRADRLQQLLSTDLSFAANKEHVWWGVSVEDRKYGLPRMDHLRSAPARIRFLSIEPLLEHLGEIDLTGIHWVIVGGESGWGARPMNEQWVLSIMEQCQRAKVPFFFKQWGGVHKAKAGRELLGRIHDGFPSIVRSEFPGKRKRLEALATFSQRFSGLPSSAVERSELPLFGCGTSQTS